CSSDLSASGAPERLATSGWIDAGVVNAGDGTHQHPTQALLDAFTIRRHLIGGGDDAAARGNDLDGVNGTIVGDVLHSRVARSNADLLHTLGANVTLGPPPTPPPARAAHGPATVSYNLDEAVDDRADAIMMLRVQAERMSDRGFFPSAMEYARYDGLDNARAQRLGERAIIMHPGPMNRGLEISAHAADSPRAVITEQVTNGVAVRMAVLYL